MYRRIGVVTKRLQQGDCGLRLRRRPRGIDLGGAVAQERVNCAPSLDTERLEQHPLEELDRSRRMLRFAHELAEASDATGLQRGRPFRPGRDPFQQRAGPLTLPAGEEKVSQIDRSASLRFRVRLAETERAR